jgi:hypothetical protein
MTEGRRSVNANTTPFLPYDMEGPVQPEMSWLPLSYDEATGQGTYLCAWNRARSRSRTTRPAWRSS